MNYTKLFPPEVDYIFYASSVTQHLKVKSQINKALKKKCGEGDTVDTTKTV